MRMHKGRARKILVALLRMPPGRRMKALSRLPPPAIRAIAEEWWWQAHGGQQEPTGDWLIWLLMAGRSHGKTRAGSEWVWARVREAGTVAGNCPLQIALVGGNLGEVLRVMIKGPSGLIATARTGESARWAPSERLLRFSNGAAAFPYSAERPESLRGPEHHYAWCDELAKWTHADETWDNLMLGLRCGEMPRALVTTTPRPVPLLRRIRALEQFAETRGTSFGNRHQSEQFLRAMARTYGGTRLGRQELDGELIEDVEGALWPRELIEKSRMGMGTVASNCPPGGAEMGTVASNCPPLRRVVVGVDPPASAAGTCGISVCALGEDGLLHVLADASESGLSPDGWARGVKRAAETWGADRVVAEANNGGEMVASVLRGAASALPVKLVHASRGKVARAEPVAAAFERGEAKFAGRFPALEDELAGMVTGGGYEGPGASPDRADAMVWAMTELMATPAAEPRIRRL